MPSATATFEPVATEGPVDEAEALLALLVAAGRCDPRAVERARGMAAGTGRRADALLVQLGLVTERELAQGFADLLGLPLALPARYPTEPVLPDRLAVRFLRQARALPLALDGGTLSIALADPLDRFTPSAVAAATGHAVAVEVAVPVELEAALDRLYPDAPAAAPEGEGEDGPLEEDAERLKDLASEAPVIRLVNGVIARAVETRASDIHIEPFEDRLRIRYRQDGVLVEAEPPPARMAAAIVSRIKIMARLDIAQRQMPQDGRIKLAVRGQEIDFRVATIPSLHGETVVMRVLDRSAVALDYEALGLAPGVVARFRAALELPNGIVLVSGPTGSGKTTTLYTGLLGLNSVERKVVTIEDPIEYQLQGIVQSQVKPGIDLTFASLLRAELRHNPDVIMVGEIRDGETAQIAVQAALTGHLVLSTVHTNSAAATIARLRDMGLEDYLLTAVLRGVLAQRLVRRLCTHCRRAEEAPEAVVERFDLRRRAPSGPIRLWHPVGCEHCRNTGYRGRMAVAEFLEPDAAIERLILDRADGTAIERAAVASGMVPMLDAGLDAALSGETTLEDVLRSIRADA
ncbi:GspE/PulE family protein [Pararoseomonas indoligenes]|uniref:Type II/IV secretion system protein n=1 Tax=Roseomonas indoligenes TaxID=2820811 RepID=A0A940N6C0_9PROT|nr:GspE/PulE family protein [Pararoseomonas indoligenes]MBP0494947.1 type II/IV secretion system protein [Pararoseomonas indoligenes]